MDDTNRQRTVYVTSNQKKKLLEFIEKHPELIACKVTQDFTYQDAHKLWQSIANECNSLPGARKTWRQWKKTWQDLRCKTKKREKLKNRFEAEFSGTEQDTLTDLSTDKYQESTEFVSPDQESDEHIMDTMDPTNYLNEPESPPETKVFANSIKKPGKNKNHTKSKKHSEECLFNCNMLAIHEQRKVEIKEEYLNFKKDYLRQKLKLMKEQTEALKTIAKELCSDK